MTSRQHRDGFTIIELLIVIVVIGILAAITIVAFNGVQQRATNTKTTGALGSWVKALTLYKADNGRWPNGWVCLGSGYSYGVSGSDASGVAQCRQDGGAGYVETTAFNDSMKPYVGSTLPVPAFVTAQTDSANWRRGLMYAYGGGGDGKEVYIMASFAGSLTVCPTLSGIAPSVVSMNGNSLCIYMIGRTTDS